ARRLERDRAQSAQRRFRFGGIVPAATGRAAQMNRVLGEALLAEQIGRGDAIERGELRRCPGPRGGIADLGQEAAEAPRAQAVEPARALVRGQCERPVRRLTWPDDEPPAAEVVDRRAGWHEGLQLEAEVLDVLQRAGVVVRDSSGACFAMEV